MDINGKLVEKSEIIQVSDKYKKREFVIEFQEGKDLKYTNYVKFELGQERCSLIDNANVGDLINVYFNIKGRKWEKDGKTSYFNSLEAWKVESASKPADKPYNGATVKTAANTQTFILGNPIADDSDLPF